MKNAAETLSSPKFLNFEYHVDHIDQNSSVIVLIVNNYWIIWTYDLFVIVSCEIIEWDIENYRVVINNCIFCKK